MRNAGYLIAAAHHFAWRPDRDCGDVALMPEHRVQPADGIVGPSLRSPETDREAAWTCCGPECWRQFQAVSADRYRPVPLMPRTFHRTTYHRSLPSRLGKYNEPSIARRYRIHAS